MPCHDLSGKEAFTRLHGIKSYYDAIKDGFDHIKVLADRLAVHENRRTKSISMASVLEFDAEYFNGKQIVCFDDVVTTGVSYATFANKLEEFGTNVLEGVFLGRTSYRYNK